MIGYAFGYNRFKQLIDKDASYVWKSEKLDLTLNQSIDGSLFSCSWHSIMVVKSEFLPLYVLAKVSSCLFFECLFLLKLIFFSLY